MERKQKFVSFTEYYIIYKYRSLNVLHLYIYVDSLI